MSDSEIRRMALDILNKMEAQYAAEEIENADSFAIVVTCEEGGSTMTWVHGPIDNYVEALRLADLHEGQLNDGMAPDDAPFVAKVYPMNEPKGWG